MKTNNHFVCAMEESLFPDLLARYEKFYRSIDLAKMTGADVLDGCPQVPARSVIRLCMRIQRTLTSESTLLQLDSPVIVVGDLHGHIGDLFRILQFGFPEKDRYIFLGDYIDRGNFSIELMILLLLLKARYPRNIFLLRGNHEFDALARTSGFYNEIMRAYGDYHVYDAFVAMFSFVPLAALVDNKILCVHGGIGPCDMSLSKIASLRRPIFDYTDPAITSLVWSDPRADIRFYSASSRGTGYCYGDQAVFQYLTDNKLTTIVRAHECVVEGVKSFFDGKVITVFSASNYCGQSNNRSGVLRIDNGEITRDTFPPLPFLKKNVSTYASADLVMTQPLGSSKPPEQQPYEPPKKRSQTTGSLCRGHEMGRRSSRTPEATELCPISPLFLQAMHVRPGHVPRH